MKPKDQKVLDLRNCGFTAKEIATELKMGIANVWRITRKHGLKFQGSGGQNRVVLSNPFEKYDEQAQYWLGFLAADGCVSKKKWNIYLVSKDIYHLERFRDYINPKLPVYYKTETTKCVFFGSKAIHSWLVSCGVKPAKSKDLLLEVPITGHMLRGIIDGDGCFSKTPRTQHKITSGSYVFLEQIKSFLREKSIDSKISVQCKYNDSVTWCLRMYDRQSPEVYALLYNDATIYLERKEIILRRSVEIRKRKPGELLEA